MIKYVLLLTVVCCSLFVNSVYGQWEDISKNEIYVTIVGFVDNGGYIFIGTSMGVFRSPDNGLSWEEVNSGLTTTIVFSIAKDEKNIFVGIYNGGLFRSTDNGDSWKQMNEGLPELGVTALAVNGTYIFAGIADVQGNEGGVFVYTDTSTSWKETGLTNVRIYSLAINETNIFAGTRNGVFLSTDNATSWKKINNGLTDTSVWSLAIKGPNIFAGTEKGVFYSTDNGTSWKQSNDALTKKTVSTFAVSGSKLFAGTRSWTGHGNSVFLSTDNGISWKETGLSVTHSITALTANETYLFSGTKKGPGGPNVRSEMHRLPLASVPVLHNPLSANTHNLPAVKIHTQHGVTKVSYNINSSCFVQFDMYTLSGKLITSLAHRMYSAGEHSVTVNQNVLPAGLYIYRFKAGTYEENNRLLIMK